MTYQSKDFSSLLETPGFSDQLLKNHFTLYEGYVKNLNIIQEALKKMRDEGAMNTPVFSELKRRFAWEFNGMRLHELYFANMSKEKQEANPDASIYKKMLEDFGTYDQWLDDFKTSGAMRGIGWVILYFDPVAQCLFNTWIEEHHIGHLAQAMPILVMDVFEHAFMLDYGLKRGEYIQSFLNALHWRVIEDRFTTAVS